MEALQIRGAATGPAQSPKAKAGPTWRALSPSHRSLVVMVLLLPSGSVSMDGLAKVLSGKLDSPCILMEPSKAGGNGSLTCGLSSTASAFLSAMSSR